MKAKNLKCTICGKPAAERAFDNTGFCKRHLRSWLKFYGKSGKPSEEAFRLWVTEMNKRNLLGFSFFRGR